GLLAMWPLTRWFLAEKNAVSSQRQRRKSLGDLGEEYQITQNLYKVSVEKGSPIVSKSLHQLNIAQQYNVNILEIEKKVKGARLFSKPVIQYLAGPDTVIGNTDLLYVWGDREQVQRFVAENKLSFVDTN